MNEGDIECIRQLLRLLEWRKQKVQATAHVQLLCGVLKGWLVLCKHARVLKVWYLVVHMCKIISYVKNTFGIKRHGQVNHTVELNAWRDWRQQDMISECGQGLVDTIDYSHCFRSLIWLTCFQPWYYAGTNFIFYKINKRSWNIIHVHLATSLFYVIADEKVAKWQIIVNFMFSC